MFICFAFIYMSVNSQIVSFTTDAVKEYNDNTRTSYITLNGIISEDLRVVIERELVSHPDVSLFSFYDNTNFNKCMFTSAISVDESQLVDMINDIIDNYELTIPDIDMLQTVYFSTTKAVKFKVSGITDGESKSKAIDKLLRDKQVVSVEINPNNICKLEITKETHKDYIKKIFTEVGIEISEITNR